MHYELYLPKMVYPSNYAPFRDEDRPNFIDFKFLTWLFICLGIFFRFFHYLDNRSLWIDEMFLCVSIIKRGLLELLTVPLENEQKAPLGYLVMAKAFVSLLGKNELGLRFFSCLSGCLSLFLFVPVARHFIKSGWGVALAVGIVALSPPIIYHSVEAKQYSTELMVSVLALFLYVRYSACKDLPSLLMWGLWGALLFWFSFPVIFILGGIAIGVELNYLLKKDYPAFFRCLVPFSLWVLSLALNYFIFLREYEHSGWLIAWFENRGGFMPFPPHSAADLMWIINKPFVLLDNPMGLTWFNIPTGSALLQSITRLALPWAVLLISGFYLLLRKNFQVFLIFILPLLLHLAASALKIYPFFERLLVYLAPVLIITLVLSCVMVVNKLSSYTRLAYLIPLLILTGPAMNSARQLVVQDDFGGYKNWHQRELLTYLNDRFQPGDAVYIYWNALNSYQFYKNTLPLKFKAIEGNDYRATSSSLEEYNSKLEQEVKKLRGNKRVWLIYSRFLASGIGDYEFKPEWYYKREHQITHLPLMFERIGRKADEFRTKESVDLILYDIGPWKK